MYCISGHEELFQIQLTELKVQYLISWEKKKYPLSLLKLPDNFTFSTISKIKSILCVAIWDVWKLCCPHKTTNNNAVSELNLFDSVNRNIVSLFIFVHTLTPFLFCSV
jgi:hypothetical protein